MSCNHATKVIEDVAANLLEEKGLATWLLSRMET
jgi:hypothetical protein